MNPNSLGQNPRALITKHVASFTNSERRIRIALLTNYPEAGLQSVAAFAELARVSSPTIIRFIRKLGYSAYSEFQEALRKELVEFKASPAQLLGTSDYEQLESFPHNSIDLSHLADEINETTKLLRDNRKKVHIFGGPWSMPIAMYLSTNLQRIRPNCHFLTPDELPPAVLEADRNSVFIVLDFRRYSADVSTAMQVAHANKAQIILITDRWISPISALAKVLLPVEIERPPFDSLVIPVALAEEITEHLRIDLGEQAIKRIKELYEVLEALHQTPSKPAELGAFE